MSGPLRNGGRLVHPRTASQGGPASVGGPGFGPGIGSMMASTMSVPQTASLTFLDQPYLPTVRQYLPVSRGRAEGQNGGAGGRLLAPSPTWPPSFWNVTVWGREKIRPASDPPFTQAQIAGDGTPTSYYKIRVQWSEYPSRLREILLDAGTAFDIAVGPTGNIFVDLMAPDPESSDARPPTYEDLRVDAYVVCSAWCTSAPIGHATGRFTQALYIPEPTTPLTRPCVRIADGARTLQVLGTVTGEPSSVFWNADGQDNSALPPLGNISVNTLPGEVGTDIVDIPQNAKAVCFDSAGDVLFTVVQGLEL